MLYVRAAGSVNGYLLSENVMNKYVVFISRNGGKAVAKELVTASLTKEMKKKGFRRHHIEVEAENEVDAIKELNKFNENYMGDVREYTGNIVIICVCFIILIFAYILKNVF